MRGQPFIQPASALHALQHSTLAGLTKNWEAVSSDRLSGTAISFSSGSTTYCCQVPCPVSVSKGVATTRCPAEHQAMVGSATTRRCWCKSAKLSSELGDDAAVHRRGIHAAQPVLQRHGTLCRHHMAQAGTAALARPALLPCARQHATLPGLNLLAPGPFCSTTPMPSSPGTAGSFSGLNPG